VDGEKFTEWFTRMEARYVELVGEYSSLKTVRQKMPDENFTIANLPSHIKAALNTDADSLLFSPDSIAKQLKEHKELTAQEYFGALGKIKDCNEMYEDGEFKIALILKNDRWYRAILKTTNDRSETYLVSLHRLNPSTLKEARKSKRIF
jgi:hypothetical protein